MRLCQQGVFALYHAFRVTERSLKHKEHLVRETLEMLFNKVVGNATMREAWKVVHQKCGNSPLPADHILLAILLYTASMLCATEAEASSRSASAAAVGSAQEHATNASRGGENGANVAGSGSMSGGRGGRGGRARSASSSLNDDDINMRDLHNRQNGSAGTSTVSQQPPITRDGGANAAVRLSAMYPGVHAAYHTFPTTSQPSPQPVAVGVAVDGTMRRDLFAAEPELSAVGISFQERTLKDHQKQQEQEQSRSRVECAGGQFGQGGEITTRNETEYSGLSIEDGIQLIRPLPNFPADGEIFFNRKASFDNMPLYSPAEVTSLNAAGGDDDASALETEDMHQHQQQRNTSAPLLPSAAPPASCDPPVCAVKNAWAHYGGEGSQIEL